jgi:putative solute:sodium symporter small subunit
MASSQDDHTAGGRGAAASGAGRAYWAANLRLMAVLLAVWALVSFGFGIWLREPLDAIKLGGAPLGFWFAQQGSIYVFVALIFIYVWRMKRLDERHGVDGSAESGERR